MKRDRPLFCFLVIRSFNSRAFSECVCVYAVVYGIHIRQCMCSSKLKTGKIRRTISRRVGWGETKETRRRERGSCVCVLVVWRCPFDDAKAPLQLLSFSFHFLFSLDSAFFFRTPIKNAKSFGPR